LKIAFVDVLFFHFHSYSSSNSRYSKAYPFLLPRDPQYLPNPSSLVGLLEWLVNPKELYQHQCQFVHSGIFQQTHDGILEPEVLEACAPSIQWNRPSLLPWIEGEAAIRCWRKHWMLTWRRCIRSIMVLFVILLWIRCVGINYSLVKSITE